MVRLLLVRHGKTEWNEAGRYQGRSDIGLSATGVLEAEALAQRLAGERIDAAYCSDLKRAAGTARAILTGRDIEAVACEELREIDFGDLEGLTFDQIRQRDPQTDWWTARDADMELPGGESIRQLSDRVSRFLARLGGQDEAQTVLVVAHGGTLRALMCLLLDLALEHLWQIGLDSASLSMVDMYSDRMVLSLLNDTCHLKGLKT